MTSRERKRLSAERRDDRHGSAGDPDAPCMGKKRTPSKPRPWVVEYKQKRNKPKIWFQMKSDNEWHIWKHGYVTRTAAERAMDVYRRAFVNDARQYKVSAEAEWRVRDTREEAHGHTANAALPGSLAAPD